MFVLCLNTPQRQQLQRALQPVLLALVEAAGIGGKFEVSTSYRPEAGQSTWTRPHFLQTPGQSQSLTNIASSPHQSRSRNDSMRGKRFYNKYKQHSTSLPADTEAERQQSPTEDEMESESGPDALRPQSSLSPVDVDHRSVQSSCACLRQLCPSEQQICRTIECRG